MFAYNLRSMNLILHVLHDLLSKISLKYSQKEKKSPTKSNHNPIFMQKCYILRLYSSEHKVTALIFLKFKSKLKNCRKTTTNMFKINCQKLKGLEIQQFT